MVLPMFLLPFAMFFYFVAMHAAEGVNLHKHSYKIGRDDNLRDVHLHPVQWHDDRQFMGKADEFSMVSVLAAQQCSSNCQNAN